MSGEVRLEAVDLTGRRGRKRFIEQPFGLYSGDPYWVPPLVVAEMERLHPGKNPFFEHAEVRCWLARREGEAVGRIAAIDDARYQEVHGDDCAFFGFFEAADAEVAAALLETAEAWARGRGRSRMRGPVDLSMNDMAGLQVKGFDGPPMIMMPYNPPEYAGWIEARGYAKAKDLWAWYYDIAAGPSERVRRLARRVEKRQQPEVRYIDMKRFDADLDHIREIFTRAWSDNWGFVPPTDAEFEFLADELKRIIVPELTLILELDGRPVAFSVTLPDLNQVFKKIGGRLLPFGIITLLRWRHHVDGARMLLLGVLPEYRRRGLELLALERPAVEAQQMGLVRGECSWTLEDNDSINKAIAAVGGEHYRTYRVYERPLADAAAAGRVPPAAATSDS